MYPLSRRRRIPSALILRAALTSLSCSAPQWGHIQCLVPKSFVPAHKAPHSEQSWEDGNHLSMTASCFPCSRSLYSKKVRNIPKPLSLVDFPSRREAAIPRRLISSTHTASHCLAIAALCWWQKSFLWLAIFS